MDIQEKKVREALLNPNCGYFHEADQSTFFKIPGSRIGYWLSEKLQNQFQQPPISCYADTRRGLQTGDSARFIRKWFEPLSSQVETTLNKEAKFSTKKWFLLNSGGSFRRWYGNIIDIVNWKSNGLEIKSTGKAIIPSEDRYFDELVSWNKVSSGQMSVRY